MENKILLLIIIILTPFTFIKNDKKVKTEDIKEIENKKYKEVYINYKDNTLEIESYVVGVVAAEMPALFNDEALKAQSISSRTFAYFKLYNNPEYVFDNNDQVYITTEEMKTKWGNNYNEYYNKIVNLVSKTKGLIMTYDKKPISSYYYAMSNGYTEDSQAVFNETEPYLESVESLWDEKQKNFEYKISISKEEFCKKLEITCDSVKISNIVRNSSNRVSTIEINNKKFTGVQVRKSLLLRSTDFYITVGDNITILTKGYGHGVGMSQYGANYLANSGMDYSQILKYYYNDIEIEKINV